MLSYDEAVQQQTVIRGKDSCIAQPDGHGCRCKPEVELDLLAMKHNITRQDDCQRGPERLAACGLDWVLAMNMDAGARAAVVGGCVCTCIEWR